MNEELRRVGTLFREKRQDLKLSLKEVENATSIRSAYLQAIEEGTIGAHISSVYAMGFLKQYAQFLGIDVQRLIRENPAAFRTTPSKPDFVYGIGTLEVRAQQRTGSRLMRTLAWIVGFVLICAVMWVVIKVF